MQTKQPKQYKIEGGGLPKATKCTKLDFIELVNEFILEDGRNNDDNDYIIEYKPMGKKLKYVVSTHEDHVGEPDIKRT